MGVDAALNDIPVNWLERGSKSPTDEYTWPARLPDREPAPETPVEPANRPAPQPILKPAPELSRQVPARTENTIRPQTPLGAGEAETEARKIARAAADLAGLERALREFSGCTLKATATNLCFYRGAARARVMIIGEAPGRDEDLEGKPFVGRAGQLLDKMLGAISLNEADVHITNIVYWRPPGNRPPTPQEALACRPFLERQMELVGPDLIVAVGGSAAKEVLGVADAIMRLRGKWREISAGGRTIPAMATLHPAYLLRAPAAKQLVWLDLLSLKARLANSV